MDFVEGEILYFNKPLHWTSFQLVKRLRGRISRALDGKRVKVGHAGTLDPLASGVMILCTGKSTKQITRFQNQTKEYVATLRLGATTPSYDLETEIDRVYPTGHITREGVEQALSRFVGTISQVPPEFSACKVDGCRAYKRVRRGEEVHLKPKELVIDEIELLDFAPDTVRLRVVCGKGTYIRALARDLGEALGCGAHLIGLVRTRVGEVTLDRCLAVEDIDRIVAEGCSPEKCENEKELQN